MGAWVTIISGREFIGYGHYIECEHCHNKGWLQIWQNYSQQRAYSIIPLPKIFGTFQIYCAICHWGVILKKKEKQRIAAHLEVGKSATKFVFDQYEPRQKERMLRNLNRNGFSELARLLTFEGHVDG